LFLSQLGYLRIRGELLKLGISVSATTIATVLRGHGLGPAPRRGPTWKEFLRQEAAGMLACDFLTVETIRLKTLYVLAWIELQTRRVHLGGATANPDSAWVTQQARNLIMSLQEEGKSARFLIHDRDTKFSGPFDEVFRSEGMRIVLTPIRAPNANAFCERWVGTLRAECLDWTIILGRRHLERILRIYIHHYNQARPHRGLALETPIGGSSTSGGDLRAANVRRRRPHSRVPSRRMSFFTRRGRPPTENEVLAKVIHWKQHRRPPLEESEVAAAVRDMNMLGWLEARSSDDLPINDEILTVA
jgi:transposase InsO family protein